MFLVTPTIAQNYPNYFKSIPGSKTGVPEWAHLMYSSNPNVFEVQKLYYDYYTTHKYEKTIHTQNYKHWFRNVRHLITKDGFIEDVESVSYKDKITQAVNKRQIEQTNKSSSIWTNIGPNTSYDPGYMAQSNVYCIEAAPSNTNIVYCGTEPGLLFKSTDKGLNWSCISLDQQFGGIYDIKVHPTNPDIVYFNSASKIYKSTDGGSTWNLIHTAAGNVEQFYIHRTEPNKVYVATANGLLYSADGGATWNTLINKRCWDIVAHATNPDILYLSVNNDTQKRAEIYKSTDKGVTWTLKDNNWYTPANVSQAGDSGCKIGVTPADPNRIYAALIGASKAGDNGWIGIYYSLDGGDTWVNADGIDGGPYVSGKDKNTNWFVAGYSGGYHQGWYNFDIDVSHNNADRLWIGTIWSCESEDKGKSIEYIRGTRNLRMHADVQDIDVIGNEIWYTSDGGINYSNDEMQTVSVRNKGIFASDFWGFGQGWNEDVWTGGRYHNGNAIIHENYGIGNAIFTGGAEAATGYINQFNNKKVYYSDTTDRLITGSYTNPYSDLTNLSKYPYESPYLFGVSELNHDPRYANHFYIGRDNILYKSTDAGENYNSLYTFNSGADVLEFEISRSNPDVIYCAVIQNNITSIFKSTNGGTTFIAITAPPSDSQHSIDLTLNPSDSNELWVSCYYGSNGKKIYRTTDGGNSWTNMTTSALDGEKVQDIVFQYGTTDVVYLATTKNVYYWNSTTSNWVTYSTGLPAEYSPVKILPFYRDGKMRMATNKGIWEAPLAKSSLPLAQPMIENKDFYCKRDTIQFNDYSVLKHAGATWEWTFNPVPSYIDNANSKSPKVVFGNSGTFDVTLKVTDANSNTNTKTVSGMIVIDNQCTSIDNAPLKAISFAGNSTSYVNTSISKTPRFGKSTDFTISFWMKSTSTSSDAAIITDKDWDNGWRNGWVFALVNGKIRMNIGDGGNLNLSAYSSAIVNDNKWHYIVGTFDRDANMILYVDGIKQAETSIANIDDIDSGYGLFLGCDVEKDYPYAGLIDEVKIWNKALTQQEIRERRHLTIQPTDPLNTNLMLYYQFNHESQNKIFDKYGMNHLKKTGATLITSDAPLGTGTSHSLTVNSSGLKTFTNAHCEMNFTTGGTYPKGELVVSKINLYPSLLPTTNYIDDTYWIVNNYGENSSFNSLNSIKFSNIQNLSQIGGATNIEWFKRSSNSDNAQNWLELTTPTTIDNGSSSVTFTTTGVLNSFSQFFIGSKVTLNTNDIINNEITVYPNPIQPGQYLTFNGIRQITSFKLFSITGKQIIDLHHVTGQRIQLPQLETGLYLYQVDTFNNTHHGKLIIKK